MTTAKANAKLNNLLEPPRPIGLEDLDEGVEILNSLEPVNRSVLIDETISFEVMKDNVFEEITKSRFVEYIRKVAGWEQPQQKRMVAYLLQVCLERSKQNDEVQAA